ncbi:MAG: polysaccharide pyruvyl transferase family protein [Clostridiales bacterium]|nr:polysaccharide pyruvyl transferase family protein [Clostridiales bacterium]
MNKDLLYPLRCLHGRIYEWQVQQTELMQLVHDLKQPTDQKVYLLGTPVHTNLGDSAIVLAERIFLEQCGFDREQIKEITTVEYNKANRHVLKHARANNRFLCCWPGGGNMGDQWLWEETFRRRAMEQLRGNKMIIFPQTLYYTDTEQGNLEKEHSVPYYNRAEITLTARDMPSYERMVALYPNARVLAVPDIVLSLRAEDFGVQSQPRESVALCFRRDIECAVSDDLKSKADEYLSAHNIDHYVTDTHWRENVTKKNRAECVTAKLEEFAKAKLVVTDRLHGMVFSAITGTPCIVFNNNNHKVKGTYDWISYLPYIQFVESFEEAEQYIPQMMEMLNCEYDNKPLQPYYQKLRDAICEGE